MRWRDWTGNELYRRSRWTNFLNSDGEKPDRQREAGWATVFAAVTPLGAGDPERITKSS